MEVNNINKQKVFFRRVSSKEQDIAMQETADSLYRQKYLPSEIKIINEFAVSANKLKINERPEMKDLIRMIQNDQVDEIYAFDRSRLFRDYYEASHFFSICQRKNVRITFTSSEYGTQQVSDSPLIEGVLNVVGDIEGKNIARRSAEAMRRFPPQKIGYVKKKELKKYVKDLAKADILNEFFMKLAVIESDSELEELLKVFKKRLKTTSESLIRIARDPFYAAYDLTTGQNKLHHVEPYLTLAQFKQLQDRNSFLSKYEVRKQLLREQNIYNVHCKKCHSLMSFHFKTAKDKAWYSCANKHSKVSISTDDLSKIVLLSLQKVINHLDIETLLNASKTSFSKIKNSLKEKQDLLRKWQTDVFEEILLKGEDLTKWREHIRYKELAKLEKETNEDIAKIELANEQFLGNKTIIKLTEDYLNTSVISNPHFLYSMLVEKLYVDENEVHLEINRFKYLRDVQLTLIYEEGSLQ
nr:recombinase family protein [Priestia koreensis]